MEGKRYCPICEQRLEKNEKLCKECKESYTKAKKQYQRELQYA